MITATAIELATYAANSLAIARADLAGVGVPVSDDVPGSLRETAWLASRAAADLHLAADRARLATLRRLRTR